MIRGANGIQSWVLLFVFPRKVSSLSMSRRSRCEFHDVLIKQGNLHHGFILNYSHRYLISLWQASYFVCRIHQSPHQLGATLS